jgi:acyl-CoA thioesterase-1
VATAAADEEPAAPAKPFVLVLLGDSLSAGQGLPADASFSAQLARELTRQGVLAEVRNASVAGDDAADGLARFDAATPEDADGVLIELGADDLARGTAPESVEASLSALIERAQSRGLWVGLIGLSAPSASDADYAAAFNAMYDELARDHGVELYPDYYSGLIDRETGEARPELFLEDGVHPTDLGVAIVAEGVADWLSDSLPRAARRGG